MITFFGNRRGMSDDVAIANCVAGLNRVKKIAEDHGVTICVELLNSKVNHPDYQGDQTAFGVAVVKAVDSPRVKLLYDIYHMQIMEGDLIKTIRDHQSLYCALPHRRSAGPPRARRHAGSELARRLPCHRRHGVHRISRARVRANTRSDHVTPRSRCAL